jgi:hypothetical protein
MYKVKIPDIPKTYNVQPFYEWMNENVGVFGKDWKWANMRTYNISVLIKNKAKASFATLRWGLK